MVPGAVTMITGQGLQGPAWRLPGVRVEIEDERVDCTDWEFEGALAHPCLAKLALAIGLKGLPLTFEWHLSLNTLQS